jgi:glycerate-2-kinase
MSVIRNASVLGVTPLRRDALMIAEAGYAASRIDAALLRLAAVQGDELVVAGKRYALSSGRVFFVGVGKCAIAAAEAIDALLGERLADGIALDVRGIEEKRAIGAIRVFAGTHPKPSEKNLEAAARIVEMLGQCTKDDLVLMLVSGGGSSLLCLHDTPLTCLEEGMLFDALTAQGATIQEMNVVRKHVSLVRGGGLAKAAYPAEVISLIVSDVPGNDVRSIASGPTVQDDTTIAEAQALLRRYGVSLPAGGLIETPKDTKYFERVQNTLLLSNHDALAAMKAKAEELDYRATIVSEDMQGEARDMAAQAVRLLDEAAPKSALLWGGETTVMLGDAHGTGGRNQELALAALPLLGPDKLLLAFASDGRDATDFAGAIADETTRQHAAAKRLSIDEALERHDSFSFFSQTGDGLYTGLLGSNVSDLLIGLTS